MGDFNFPTGLDINPLHLPNDTSISRTQQEDWIKAFGIAGRVWEAAPYLALYLRPESPASAWHHDPPCSIFDPAPSTSSLASVILELGSGNGFLGIHALSPSLPAGSTLILSDLEEVTPLLSTNVDEAKSKRIVPQAVDVQVRGLQWGERGDVDKLWQHLGSKKLSHILCSDLVYFPHLLEPLLKSLLWLTDDEQQGPDIEVIIGYKIRSLTKETPFWESFGVYFDIWPVIRRERRTTTSVDDDEGWQDGSTDKEQGLFIFVCRRKKGTSFGQSGIPDDVMQGKDGQFEEILMLQSMQDEL